LNIHTELVKYHHANTNYTGMFTWDDSSAQRRPGVLVVHGGAGLDDHAKGRARRVAEMGYLAFACDMYGEGIAGDRGRVMSKIMELRAEPTRLCAVASAGTGVLGSHPLLDSRIAALGYCFGGMTVLELARSGADLRGAISVHGTLSTPAPASPGKIQCKLLICHGALDPHVPLTQVTTFIEEMNAANADWQLIAYSGAQHGFTHENATSTPGVAYNAQADARSQQHIRRFLQEIFVQ
jgi:dienelactone hydrolase